MPSVRGRPTPKHVRLWRAAAVAALCAAAGSPVWGAAFLGGHESGESWTIWVARCTAGVLIASFFFEPIVRHLQAGRLPALLRPRFRSASSVFRWALVIVIAGLLAEAYRDGIFKSVPSIGEWGATSLIVGLMTYAWLRAIDAPYVEASDRAEWLGALGALGFTLIGAAVDVYHRSRPGVFIPELATWLDQFVMQWAIRLVLWGVIGRLGVWIVTRASTVGPVARLMLAAVAAGGILEALTAGSLWWNSAIFRPWLDTTPGAVLLLYPFVTFSWCAGIWLATPRSVLGPTAAPDAGPAATTRPRMAHRTRLGILCAAVVVIALWARLSAPPLVVYANARIDVFVSREPSPDPYGLRNFLTPAFPGAAETTRYVHAVVTVSHARQRSRKIEVACVVGDSARNPLTSPQRVEVDLPDAVASREHRLQTSWIVSFGGPDQRWNPGSYKVECRLPRDVVSGDFTLR